MASSMLRRGGAITTHCLLRSLLFTKPASTALSMNGLCRRVASASTQRIRGSRVSDAAALYRDSVQDLFEAIGSAKEVKYWMKHYSGLNSKKFAIIRVSGEAINDPEQTLALCQNLSFLHKVGLYPIIIHGASEQLHELLEAMEEPIMVIDGVRVMDESVFRVARQVYARTTTKLLDGLAMCGTRARFLGTAVLNLQPIDVERYGKVGSVQSVNVGLIEDAIDAGTLPVLTMLGTDSNGQILFTNANDALFALAEVLQPEKVIYISREGGLYDNTNTLIPNINVDDAFHMRAKEEALKPNGESILEEIDEMMSVLPLSSSVSITSAADLKQELFTHKGQGTYFKRSEKVLTFDSLADVDLNRLRNCLEASFGKRLKDDYFVRLSTRVNKVYISESYRATAILTNEEGTNIPYMCKFAVTSMSQGEGTGNLLWRHITRDNKSLFWRSRTENDVNLWYFDQATGAIRIKPDNYWTLFWYGIDDMKLSQPLLSISGSIPPSFFPAGYTEETPALSPVLHHPRHFDKSGLHEKKVQTPHTIIKTAPRRFSSVASHRCYSVYRPNGGRPVSPPDLTTAESKAVFCVGLLGARGYVGAELCRLLAGHSNFDVVLASSRAFKGDRISDIVKFDGLETPLWGNVKFEDLGPDQLADRAKDIDLWYLALPNNLAAKHVEKIAPRNPNAVMVDLSADYRFDDTGEWIYGFPEMNRNILRGAKRISNPGCYATGIQSALMPITVMADNAHDGVPRLAELAIPSAFGVSGYSGAGTTPSPKNDSRELKDNLMPYALTGHIHESEVSRHLNHPIFFMPHVAPHFRGISMTVSCVLREDYAGTADDVAEYYKQCYEKEPLIKVLRRIPFVREIQGRNGVIVGGFAMEGRRRRNGPIVPHLVVTSVIDNLLKGAATQALQNTNLAFNLPEFKGINPDHVSNVKVPTRDAPATVAPGSLA